MGKFSFHIARNDIANFFHMLQNGKAFLPIWYEIVNHFPI